MQWVVEDCLILDSNRLAKSGWFRRGIESGKVTWDSGANVGVRYRGGNLELLYTLNGEPQRQSVPIERVLCRFGGHRHYFRCPGCQSRRYKLHCASSGFYCRACYRLPYYSQECGLIEGIAHKINKLESRLENLPKHARTRTVEGLVDRLEVAERQWSGAMLDRFGASECLRHGLDMG